MIVLGGGLLPPSSNALGVAPGGFDDEIDSRITTRDLRVVDDAKLGELVAKGPNYREPDMNNWKHTEIIC